MRNSVTFLSAAATVLALAVPVFAGGFWIVLGNPEANPQARAQNAVLTFKMAGCHEPEKAAVSVTAIGIVDGQRRSVTLKTVPLGEPGSYAVSRQWPNEGKWVLQIVATDHGRHTSAMVADTPAGLDRTRAKLAMRQPAPEEVAAMLEGLPSSKLAQK